jgi:hypothetical protein
VCIVITRAEMTALYESTCIKTRRGPDVAEFKAWLNKLAMFDKRDIDGALVEWSGQSRFLPTAAELLPIASRIRNARIAKATAEKLLVAWRCPTCGTGCCGFVDAADHSRRFCRALRRSQEGGRRCGAIIQEILRTAYRSEDTDKDEAA